MVRELAKIMMLLLCLAGAGRTLYAQVIIETGPPADMTITTEMRDQVIEKVLKVIHDNYVFPETAAAIEQAIQDRIKAREYASITSGRELAKTLTANLQDVSHDKHLRIFFSAKPLREKPETDQPSPEEVKREREEQITMNSEFRKVERLPGNIGYVDFRAFLDPEVGADTVASAFNFLANTDALIIDMRHNAGGDPAMVALVCSYLFDEKPVHLNDLYWRKGNRTEAFWTRKDVAGKRYLGKEVYVLTSNRTFSAAEEFTNNLKVLKRATIVGETTGGGANPTDGFPINDHYRIFVPTGRAINPYTKTNWEGTGVKPDVEVAADQALQTAQDLALKRLLEKAGPEKRERIQMEIEIAKEEQKGNL